MSEGQGCDQAAVRDAPAAGHAGSIAVGILDHLVSPKFLQDGAGDVGAEQRLPSALGSLRADKEGGGASAWRGEDRQPGRAGGALAFSS